MVISGVAERLPERLRALIYLDAMKPAPGACSWDYLSPAARAAFDADTCDGFIAPKSAAAFAVNLADREWVDAKCTPQPRATFFEWLPLTNHRAGLRKLYVSASRYDSPMLNAFADEAVAEPGWWRTDLPHGHDLMIDAPQAIADILLAEASRATAPAS